MIRRPGWTALVVVLSTGCAHSAPPGAPPKVHGHAALEAKTRVDLGPDPSRELAAPAPKPKPRPPPVVRAPPPPAPRVVAARALRKASHGKDCRAIHAAIAAYPAASPEAVRRALHAALRCEERVHRLARARRTALAWLRACGPHRVGRCRARALYRVSRLARRSPLSRALLREVKALRAADACVAKLERRAPRSKRLDPCWRRADHLYRRSRDDLMRARIALARARHAVAQKSPSARRRLERAARLCRQARCARVRSRALEALAGWAAKKNQPALVLEARLEQDQIAAQALAPEERPYSRSARTDAACDAVDAARGAGTCRILEKRLTGKWTFHDWSAQQVEGEIPRELVQRCNADFGVTLKACFRAQAARLPVPSTAFYRVSWMITDDGRADQVQLDPPAADLGPLLKCLRRKFALWRYPRSDGENQHVSEGFTISATPH